MALFSRTQLDRLASRSALCREQAWGEDFWLHPDTTRNHFLGTATAIAETREFKMGGIDPGYDFKIRTRTSFAFKAGQTVARGRDGRTYRIVAVEPSTNSGETVLSMREQ